MDRKQAISQFGIEAVKAAVSAYEDDPDREPGRVFFPEDCQFNGDHHPSKTQRLEMLENAKNLVQA